MFTGEGTAHERVPAYILRPAPPDYLDAPALEWVLIGKGIAHDAALLRAWDIASVMGIGPERRRFHIRAVRALEPDGRRSEGRDGAATWRLDEARWPIAGDPASTPCRLRFDVPLRLMRRHRLIEDPGLPDIAIAALRRVEAFLPPTERARLLHAGSSILDYARGIRFVPWRGAPLNLHRYSGKQKAELEFHGVAGRMELPDGPGGLWPLLAAATWLHIGKGTVVGLGQLRIEPL